MSDTSYQNRVLGEGAAFMPTCWTNILAAGRGEEQCFGDFCQQYWHPLYAFARRSGKDLHQAQDLTQSFFLSLMEKSTLEKAVQGKGKFRNYLLVLFKRFILN